MSQLSDHQIYQLCDPQYQKYVMIKPFLLDQVRRINDVRAISFGTSSYGYDARLAPTNFKLYRYARIETNLDQPSFLSGHDWDQRQVSWKQFPARKSGEVKDTKIRHVLELVADPKNLDPRLLQDLEPITDETGTYFVVPAHGYCLAETVEYFHMPRNVISTCLGKSTNVLTGISANVTPLEPGWHGKVTLELGNWLPVPVKMYANEGIAQFIFWKGDRTPDICYGDRDGKYQGQQGTTLPKV